MAAFKFPRWILLCLLVLAVILVPFLLFGQEVDQWAARYARAAADRRFAVALALALLLAADVLAPVPSSLIGTALGGLLGLLGGALVSFAAMTLGCVAAWLIGASVGRGTALRLIGSDEIARLENAAGRFGDWTLIVMRPVPVLAEASTIFAGMSLFPFRRFMLMTGLANLGISAVYAAVGAWAAELNSFLLAFAGAILVPMAAMLALRGTTKGRVHEKEQA